MPIYSLKSRTMKRARSLNIMKRNINRLKILLKNLNYGKIIAIVIISLSFYAGGVNEQLVYAVLGISSSLVMNACFAVICSCIFFSLTALNFERKNAREAITISKKMAFAAAFVLLTYIAAPIIFMISASVFYKEWTLLVFSVISGLFPFATIILFILGYKDIQRGLRKELRYRNPPSICKL